MQFDKKKTPPRETIEMYQNLMYDFLSALSWFMVILPGVDVLLSKHVSELFQLWMFF